MLQEVHKFVSQLRTPATDSVSFLLYSHSVVNHQPEAMSVC